MCGYHSVRNTPCNLQVLGNVHIVQEVTMGVVFFISGLTLNTQVGNTARMPTSMASLLLAMQLGNVGKKSHVP